MKHVYASPGTPPDKRLEVNKWWKNRYQSFEVTPVLLLQAPHCKRQAGRQAGGWLCRAGEAEHSSLSAAHGVEQPQGAERQERPDASNREQRAFRPSPPNTSSLARLQGQKALQPSMDVPAQAFPARVRTAVPDSPPAAVSCTGNLLSGTLLPGRMWHVQPRFRAPQSLCSLRGCLGEAQRQILSKAAVLCTLIWEKVLLDSMGLTSK